MKGLPTLQKQDAGLKTAALHLNLKAETQSRKSGESPEGMGLPDAVREGFATRLRMCI